MVITHANLAGTHVSISYWDWETHGAVWAEWNGFATLPNAKVVFMSLVDNLCRKVPVIQDNRMSPSQAKPRDEKPKQKRGPQLETENSLRRLREIRSDAIKHNRSIPTKAAAMDEAGITDKTWKKYDKGLWARWDDKSYQQEKRE